MVTRTGFRTVLTAVGLYLGAALLIGYFGVNAYTGAHGLKAKQDLVLQIGELGAELERLKLERADWQHRVALLRAGSVDPDMLDERARIMLDYMHPRELTMMLKPSPPQSPGR